MQEKVLCFVLLGGESVYESVCVMFQDDWFQIDPSKLQGVFQKSEHLDTDQLDLRLLELFHYVFTWSEVLLCTIVDCRREKSLAKITFFMHCYKKKDAVFGVTLSGTGKTDHS